MDMYNFYYSRTPPYGHFSIMDISLLLFFSFNKKLIDDLSADRCYERTT